MATVLKAFLTLIISVLSVLGAVTTPYEPMNPQECKLSFATISDLHVESTEYHPRNSLYTDITVNPILWNLERRKDKLDALVFSGDITDHGYESQWKETEKLLTRYDVAEEIVLAPGNHDLWTENENGKNFKDLFIEYNKKISDRTITELYYSTEINGYPFIVISGEEDMTPAHFSDKQLSWLENEMNKACEKNLPIFVICHWPINQTHGLPEIWGEDEPKETDGGIGEQSDLIENILKKYKNVFYISGHLHADFSHEGMKGYTGYQSIESDGSFHSINLPRTNATSLMGEPFLGYGYIVEAYEDKVVFRARNYLLGFWNPAYDYTIELV